VSVLGDRAEALRPGGILFLLLSRWALRGRDVHVGGLREFDAALGPGLRGSLGSQPAEGLAIGTAFGAETVELVPQAFAPGGRARAAAGCAGGGALMLALALTLGV